jgi:hypothetical protein
MIHPIDIAEAHAELERQEFGDHDWIVVANGYPRRFHSNLCGYQASAVVESEATHFDSIHEAGAACRAARLTGEIRFAAVSSGDSPQKNGRGINGRGMKTDSTAPHSTANKMEAA